MKSAVLLAGLRADGRTTVRESVATRDHTERMLRARGVPVERGGSDGRRDLVGARRDRACRRWTAGAGRRVRGRLLAGRRRDPSRRRADRPRRGAQPDAPRGHRPAPRDGRRHRRATGRRHDRGDRRRRRRRADRRPRRAIVRASTGSTSDATDVAAAIDEIPVLVPRGGRRRWARRRSAAPASCATRNRTGIAGVAAGLTALGARDRRRRRRPAHRRRRPPARRDDRQPRRPSAGDDLRDRRAHRATGVTTIERPASAGISYPGFFDDLERVRA